MRPWAANSMASAIVDLPLPFSPKMSAERPHLGGRSALIFGENGSGKSTIADAIEFAAQGRIGRGARFRSELHPHLINYASNGRASCALTFTDGSTLTRRAWVE